MAFAGMNYVAIFIAAVAGWITGAAWYNIFGNIWLTALGRSREDLNARRGTPAFYLPFVLALAACGVMAWMLAGVIGHLGPGQVTLRNGLISAAFLWFGFVLTTMTVNNAFGGRKWALTVIDGGHWLVVLLVMGAIIGALGT
ncbi:MAG TPA: DUF1761 domain-containing protein [Pseudorhodoplanes sp.]|jgi:hypothetical protein|nr:DUF1761 domain-containing protein [Pseudorhodoplanes sp.]